MIAAATLLIHTLLTSFKDLPFFRESSQPSSSQVCLCLILFLSFNQLNYYKSFFNKIYKNNKN